MDNRPNSDLAVAYAAALAWWQEAGVDCGFEDLPVNWIAPSEPQTQLDKPIAPPPAPARQVRETASPPAPPVPDRDSWPQDLGAFAEWWRTEPWLDAGRVADRVPPRGTKDAELMAIVTEPEATDRDRLLSGPQGRLLEAFLDAAGLDLEKVYVASALPRPTPMADWDDAARRGMGEVLSHHVSLVNPQRIIAFGGNILPLIGNDLPNSAEILRRFNQEGCSIPLLAATDLAVLLARPRAKARLWQLWLDWTGNGTT